MPYQAVSLQKVDHVMVVNLNGMVSDRLGMARLSDELTEICDVEWGQEPRAVVVLKKGESATPEEMMEYCRPRLAGFKRPRSVLFVDTLPRNPMGKVLRKRLREEYGKP